MVRLKWLARRASVPHQGKTLANRLGRRWVLGGCAFFGGCGVTGGGACYVVRLKLLARSASAPGQGKALADRLVRPWALGGFAFLVGVGSPVEAPAKWCV